MLLTVCRYSTAAVRSNTLAKSSAVDPLYKHQLTNKEIIIKQNYNINTCNLYISYLILDRCVCSMTEETLQHFQVSFTCCHMKYSISVLYKHKQTNKMIIIYRAKYIK